VKKWRSEEVKKWRSEEVENSTAANPHERPTTLTPAWFTPPWRNTFIITAIGILAWPYLPTPDRTPASPHTSPSEFQRIKSDPNTPWITRKWASMMEDPQTLLKKNDEHIDDSMRLAESRLSIQDAERPAVSRIRNRQ